MERKSQQRWDQIRLSFNYQEKEDHCNGRTQWRDGIFTSIYNLLIKTLAEEHEPGVEKDPSRRFGFFLYDPPYSSRRRRKDDQAVYDLFSLNDMKDMATIVKTWWTWNDMCMYSAPFYEVRFAIRLLFWKKENSKPVPRKLLKSPDLRVRRAKI